MIEHVHTPLFIGPSTYGRGQLVPIARNKDGHACITITTMVNRGTILHLELFIDKYINASFDSEAVPLPWERWMARFLITGTMGGKSDDTGFMGKVLSAAEVVKLMVEEQA